MQNLLTLPLCSAPPWKLSRPVLLAVCTQAAPTLGTQQSTKTWKAPTHNEMLAASLRALQVRDPMADRSYTNGLDNGSLVLMSTPSHMLMTPSGDPAVLAVQADGDSVDYHGLQRRSLVDTFLLHCPTDESQTFRAHLSAYAERWSADAISWQDITMAHDGWTWRCVPYAELMIRLIPQLRELAPTEAAIHDMA
eukprot:9475896-Pyramimonas_sp.AAC.1